MIEEKWILSGVFVDGSLYQDKFDNIFDATNTINQIHIDWQTSLNLIDPSECVNPFSLVFRNNNTQDEINNFLDI